MWSSAFLLLFLFLHKVCYLSPSSMLMVAVLVMVAVKMVVTVMAALLRCWHN